MGSIFLSPFKKKNAHLLAFAALTFTLSATTTHAGFEWVPSETRTAVPPAQVETAPMEPKAQDLLNHQDQVLSPLPEAPAKAVTNAQPPAQPQPQPQPVIRSVTPQTAPAPVAAKPQPLMDAPAPITPPAPKAQEPVMAEKPLQKAPMPPRRNLAQPPGQTPVREFVEEQKAQMSAAPRRQKIDVSPEPAAQNKKVALSPVATNTTPKVIMPDDAPASAMQKISDDPSAAEPININPFPVAPAPAATPEPMDTQDIMAEPAAPAAAANVAERLPENGEGGVSGFGSDVPLAIALGQIIPQPYSYGFAEGVNAGVRVSWSGGDSWSQVLLDMIAPHGLTAQIQGNSVVITHSQEQHSALEIEPMPAPVQETATIAAPAETVIPVPDAEPVTVAELKPAPEITATLPPEPAVQAEPETITFAPSPDAPLAAAPQQTAAPTKTMARPPSRRMVKDPGVQAGAQPEATVQMLDQKSAQNAAPKAANTDTFADKAPQPKSRIVWEAREGDSLKQTLENWSRIAGLDLEWNARHDYALTSDVLVAGNVHHAIKAMIINGVDGGNKPELKFEKSAEASGTGKLIVNDRG